MDICRASTITSLATLGFAAAAVAGELQGVVQLDGPVPAPTTLTIKATSEQHPIEGCGALTQRSQRLLVDPHGGVHNAVVWVEVPGTVREPGDEAARVLDQRECVFEPHVLLLPAGGTLAIRNSDPLLHNVRIFRERAMLLHEWQPPQGPDLTWRFDEPGRYLVRCGVHAWMYAWVVATDQRYAAVTDQAGRFMIAGIPNGSYPLWVWHETLGEHQQRVTVAEGRVVVTVRVAHDGGST
jgi:plastocyanin